VGAVEEGPAVERDRARRLARVERVEKEADVALDHRRVEPQLGGAEQGVGSAEHPAEHVQRLLERAARALRVALRPEQRHQLVAARAVRAGDGDRGEQRQRLALRSRAGDGVAVRLQAEPAEGAEAEHVMVGR
jgi:hypothetical protein